MKTLEQTLPIYWASYLIDGDASGLEDDDQAEIDSYLASLDGWSCVGVSDDYDFRPSNDASNLGGDCATYTFINF